MERPVRRRLLVSRPTVKTQSARVPSSGIGACDHRVKSDGGSLMGWLWIAAPVAFLALVALWDRRAPAAASAQGSRGRGPGDGQGPGGLPGVLPAAGEPAAQCVEHRELV